MVRENRQRFIAELRSGKYPQTVGSLVKEIDGRECFCALGVALLTVGCVTCTMQGFRLFRNPDDQKLANELGLTSEDITGIVELNDSDLLSFAEIADVLEDRWGLT